MSSRDVTILKMVLKYTDEIAETIKRFDLDLKRFKKDNIAKNAISMCIL